MRRIDGENTVDLGGGKLGFRDRNAQIGQVGTTLTAAWLNELQEEVASFIEAQGVALAPGTTTQLATAISSRIIARMREFGVAVSSGNAPQSGDADALLASGLYYLGGTAVNRPFDWNAFHLFVHNSLGTQFGYQFAVEQARDGIAFRRRENDAWQPWRRLVTPEYLASVGLDIGMVALTATQTFDPAAYGIPPGAKILAALWGGGGGGASQQNSAGGAGGAGGFSAKVVAAAAVTVTIGAGGIGNTSGSHGTAGGTTSWGSVFSATGGSPGSAGAGQGGSGTGGDINLDGSAGDDMLGSDHFYARGGTSVFLGVTRGVNSSGSGGNFGGGGSALFTASHNYAENGGPGLCLVFWRK